MEKELVETNLTCSANTAHAHSEVLPFFGEILYRQLVERMLEGVLVVDNDDVIQYVNPMFCQLLGYQDTELLGYLGYEILLNKEDRDTILKKNKQRQSGISDEYTIPMLHKNGSELIFRLKASPLIDSSGCVIGSMAICLDITEKVKADAKIKELFQQKELLLREVHHRIKNNMSTIRGLLALQAYSIEEESAVIALNDAQSRIMSMMVIYDKLYRSSDFRNISVADYLNDLTTAISETFAGLSDVQIEASFEDCVLHSDTIFNLGIIFTELLTNSYKYAFPNGIKGKISIQCNHQADNQRLLLYSDNGIGIPESILTKKHEGFGLNLIEMLVDQIHGKMQIWVDGGTHYQITF